MMKMNRVRTIDRKTMVLMLNGAIEGGEFRFAYQAAMSWLAAYPGDLEIRFLQTRALLSEGHPTQCIQSLEQIARKDPQYRLVYPLLADLYHAKDQARYANALTHYFALGGAVDKDALLPWGEPMRVVCQAITAHQWNEAGRLIPLMLRKAPESTLAATLHLLWSQAVQQAGVVAQLAQLYRSRWPDCVAINLILAAAQLGMGNEQDGVRLMYQSAAEDCAGQVTERIWGENHPYRAMWPEEMVISFEHSIPISAATRLGWNQLDSGGMPIVVAPRDAQPITQPAASVVTTPSAPMPATPVPPASATPADTASAQPETVAKSKPETDSRKAVRTVEEEFDRLAKQLRRPDLSGEDGRYPVYVIFSSRSGLIGEYGAQTAHFVDQELKRLSETVSQRTGWHTLLFYPDDPCCADKFGMDTADPSDPWKLKLALRDLDRALAKRGERIGCLLIVGGDRIVPFHRLPNPADDGDHDVPSDSPYATLDSNYFVPEWPVGRMPGEPGPDAGFLLEQLRRMNRYHAAMLAKEKVRSHWMQRILTTWSDWRQARARHSLGYTAAVWQRASMAVYRSIGAPHTILASPPQSVESIDPNWVTGASLGYYNLHGTEDTPYWYGQRDPAEQEEGPDYPIALRPSDLQRNGKAPRVVYSEACYGALITDRCENDQVALKFLGIGTQAVVASTCISYGFVTTPLISADLLGSLFWRYLKAGNPAGDALFQARVELAREMERRQGCLDPQDQKTLISFILLGDPLVVYDGLRARSKSTRRLKDHLMVKVVNQRAVPLSPTTSNPGFSEAIARAKSLAAEYLPGAGKNYDVHLAVQSAAQGSAAGGSIAGGSVAMSKGIPGDTLVVTVSKQVRVAKSLHRHYLHVTMDADGKPLKMSVSK